MEVVDELLTTDECAELVVHLEQSTPEAIDTKMRKCARLLYQDARWTERLWLRLRAAADLARAPHVDEYGDVWAPDGLNTQVTLARYDPGGHFARHCDGVYTEAWDRQSQATLLVYLNDTHGEGCTRFWGDGGVTTEVTPQPGRALLFTTADAEHDAAPNPTRLKYIMRVDVMYRLTTAKDAAARRALHAACTAFEQHELEGCDLAQMREHNRLEAAMVALADEYARK